MTEQEDPARIAFETGYLVGHFIKYGIQAWPSLDDDGKYVLDEINLEIPSPDRRYPPVTAVLKVEGWIYGWGETE